MSKSPYKAKAMKPVNIRVLNGPADDAGGAKLDMLTYPAPKPASGNNGASSMFDGPYGARKPQSGR
jgi:hypothetical protein